VKNNSNSKVRLIHFNRLLLSVLNKINNDVYKKVFGSLVVKCNLSDSVYLPSSSIEDGIIEML